MKTKYTISVLFIAFLMVFSIPIFGGPPSITNINTKMGIQTSDLTPGVEIEDFSYEEHGTTGLDIDFIDEYHGYISVYCDQYINDGPIGTHSKVLYVRDAQGGLNTWSVHYLDNSLTHGTIEFSLWLNPGSSCTSPHYHYLKFRTFSDIIAFELRFNLENGNVEYTDGSSYSSNVLNLDTQKWYDYELTIDASLGLYDLRCSEDGTQIEQVEDISYNNIVAIEELYIGTNVNDYGANSRWDDFRFTTDIIDITDPTTTIELSGNLGLQGWYKSEVNVALEATDDYSGVNRIEYSFDEVNWNTYTSSFTIIDEGETTIYYQSVDNAGNVELVKTQLIKIDFAALNVEIEDFSYEEHGTAGLDIDFIDEYHGYVSVYCDQYINDGPIGTHSKVLYVRDAQGGLNTWSVHYLDNSLTHGTIEFSLWLNPGSSCTSPHYHYLKFRTFSDIIAFELRFNLENGNVEYTDGSSYSSNVLNLDTQKWYDYELTIDASLGLYDLRCSEEGTQIEHVEDISYNNIVAIEELYIGTNVNDYGANSRWDDFRFTLETPYITDPTTTIELSGNLGLQDWYKSVVDVTLEATDDYSGVNRIEYSFNEVNWFTYTSSFTITDEGETTIYYQSVDNAGNVEPVKNQLIKIDFTAPTTTIELDGIHLSKGWYLSNIYISLSITDDDSGLSFTEYSLFKWEDGTHNWQPYTGPFLYVPSGLNFWYFDLYYRSTDLAGNSETPKSITIKLLDNPVSLHRNFEMIAQDYYDSPDNAILWNVPPPEAEHVMEKAVFFLQQASDKFELGMIYEGFDKVRDSMEFLLRAEDMGVDNQKVLDYIMTVLNYSVYFQLEDVIDNVSEDTKFAARAIELYDTALSMLVFEDYKKTVQYFKLSLKNTNKARGELIDEAFINDLQDKLNDIQELKTEVQQQEPLNYLEQAENKLLLAIEKANNSLLAQSLNQIKDAVINLLDVQDFGIDSGSIIDAILSDTDDITYLKIIEAETILMGEGGWELDNMHIDKAWINYNKAVDYWNAGNFQFALSYYAKAIEKVKDALT